MTNTTTDNVFEDIGFDKQEAAKVAALPCNQWQPSREMGGSFADVK